MELKELYQEIILDHGKNPRNKGKCKDFNHDAKAHNPLCGDKVHIYLNLDQEKIIKNICAFGSRSLLVFKTHFPSKTNIS